jgi:hypothetical protein
MRCCNSTRGTVANRRRLGPNPTSGHGPRIAPIRQRIQSIFWTLKDRFGLERHNARTLHASAHGSPPNSSRSLPASG